MSVVVLHPGRDRSVRRRHPWIRAGAVARVDGQPERTILRQRYAEGLTFREIADSTHTAISTLHSRAESALAKIRKKLGKARRGA